SPDRNRITEVACVFVEGMRIVDEKRTLVNPEQFIPAMITQMTGISNAMVVTAPRGGEIFPAVREWFRDASIFAAHNATFDFGFLQQSFRRHQIDELTQPKLCTVRLTKRLVPGKRGYSLAHVAAHFGIKIQGRHSALGDARATAQV